MTVGNYQQFNQLIATYGSEKLTVLGFPCSQFYDQEPGENNEILNCLKYVRPGSGFVPSFQLMAKGDVNGANEQPIFTWLKSSCGWPPLIMDETEFIDWSPVRSGDIGWNFNKFIIDKNGNPYKRYTSEVFPLDPLILKDLNHLLNA